MGRLRGRDLLAWLDFARQIYTTHDLVTLRHRLLAAMTTVFDGDQRLRLVDERRTATPSTQELERLGLSRRQAVVLVSIAETQVQHVLRSATSAGTSLGRM